MNEVWKDIKGYEGKYKISNTGKIKKEYPNSKEIISKLKSIKEEINRL